MIPKSLKSIDAAKAEQIVAKHLKDATGHYDYHYGTGDNESYEFIYYKGNRPYMIRKMWGHYETGPVAQ